MRVLLIAIVWLWAASVEAKTLYVNGSTGNNNTTYANNDINNPWQTIGRAAWGSTDRATPSTTEAAQAGDIVQVAGGTYNYSGTISSRWSVAYNPANNGSVGNYIEFRCVGVCVLTAPTTNSPLVGSDAKNYIKWYADVVAGYYWQIRQCGREVTCPSDEVDIAPDTSSVVCHDATACWLEGFHVDGGLQTQESPPDNYSGIRLEGCAGCTTRNNTLWSFHNGSDNVNGAGITIYCGGGGSIVEHNTISDAGTGIYYKDIPSCLASGQHIARLNHFSDLSDGVGLSWQNTTAGYRQIYSNLLVSVGGCFRVAGTGWLSGDLIANNTCVGASKILMQAAAAGGPAQLHGNICVTCTYIYYSDSYTMPADTVLDAEHNCYYGFTTFYHGSDGDKNFATYLSTYTGQDQAATATVNADPSFVSAAGGNYRLSGGSPCANIQTDLLDLDADASTVDAVNAGAYVTGNEVLGIEAVVQPTRFNPAINLRRSEIEILRDDLLALLDEQARKWVGLCAVVSRTRTTWASNMRREIPC